MALTDAALRAMANHLASLATKASLHSADPGTTGANETTAGRQTIAWNPATGSGNLTLAAAVNFTGGAASSACKYVGLWDATGTTFYGGYALTGDQAFNSAGTYQLTNLAINGAAS